MEKSEPELMSKNAYAKYLGIDEKAVRNAVTTGKISKGYDPVKKKIIKNIADEEFGFSHQVQRQKPGVSKKKFAEKFVDCKVRKIGDSKKTQVRKNKAAADDENSESESSENYDDDIFNTAFKNMTTAEILNGIVIHPGLSYNEAFRLTAIVTLCQGKMKAEESQGMLVKKDLVFQTLFAFGTELKNALNAIPARVIDEMMTAETKVEAMNALKREITETLLKFATFDKIKIN